MLHDAIELHRAVRGGSAPTLDAVRATVLWYRDTMPDERETADAMLAAVDAAIAAAHTGAGPVAVGAIGDVGPTVVPGVAVNAADIGDKPDPHVWPARAWPTAPAVSHPVQQVATGRTTVLPSARQTEAGHVPVQRTMGRGTDADAYPVLQGAPVGAPETLDAQRARLTEAEAERRAAEFLARRDERAGLTPRQRKRLRSGKARASAADILARLEATTAALRGPR